MQLVGQISEKGKMWLPRLPESLFVEESKLGVAQAGTSIARGPSAGDCQRCVLRAKNDS